MEFVATINIHMYSCVSERIRSNEVYLTENQKEHIINRRGRDFYEQYSPYFREVIEKPDYIFKDKAHENTAIASKTILVNGKHLNLVVRLAVEDDREGLENSVITAIVENDRRYSQRLRNNIPLYKSE